MKAAIIKRLIVGTALGAVVQPAFAQDMPPASAPSAPAPATADDTPVGNAFGEITVLARKRQESILQVPVIETVLSAELLDQRQVASITDIATMTPGLILGLSSLEVGTQVSIRGIGSTSLDPGIDQSISLNLDGLQVTQGSAYSVGVFDMAQVEVLKGPQALFFGKNSPGGVIAIRSADPGQDPEFLLRGGYEPVADEWRGEAVLSGPLTDSLGLRVATMYSDFGGFFRNLAVADPTHGAVQPAPTFGHTTTFFIRGTALFKPSSDFTARLKVNYSRDRQLGGAAYQLTSCPDGLTSYTGVRFFSPNEDCKADRNLNIVDLNPADFGGGLSNDGRPFTHITQKFGTLELNYNLSPQVSLISLTGYYDLDVHAAQNGTFGGFSGPALWAEKRFGRREFTQELRLETDLSGPVNFSGGAFYQNGKMTNDILIPGNTTIAFAPGFPIPPRLQEGTHDVRIESISFFGQGRFKPAADFEIALGTRWTQEKRRDDAVTSFFGGPFAPVPAPRISSNNWSPELTLTYTPTDDLTLFGSLKQAYKSGSYNLIVPAPPGTDNSFGDERVRGGEIGLKARLADRQLLTNLAFYYYKYDGLQVGINEVQPGNGLSVFRTVNAGSAKIYGIDFDLNYRPSAVPGLDIRAAANWNHARFTEFDGAPCWGGQTIGEGCNQAFSSATGLFTGQNLAGTPLTRAPDWQLTAGISYELPVGKGMSLSLGADGQYSSKYLTNLGLNRPDYYQQAFAKLNINAALKGPNDAWEFAVIGNNLTNRLTSGNCINVNTAGGQVLGGVISGGSAKGPSGSDELICTLDRGRAVWLRVTLRPSAWTRR